MESVICVRHGWLIQEVEEQIFNCVNESEGNIQFLMETLELLGVEFEYKEKILSINSMPVPEEEFIKMIDFPHRGRTELIGEYPNPNKPNIKNLDTYICEIVRQLNRLGFYTIASCDGHEIEPAHILFTVGLKRDKLLKILSISGAKRLGVREYKRSYRVNIPLMYSELLYLAEKLGEIKIEWVKEKKEFIQEQPFYKELEQLLKIPGASGNEEEIRKIVQKKLAQFVDFISVDRHGNLLAEKTYRTGHGPTILLNAHLDIASEIVAGRSIIKKNGIWRSSQGILGVDDRAGVAVLLYMAEHLPRSVIGMSIRMKRRLLLLRFRGAFLSLFFMYILLIIIKPFQEFVTHLLYLTL